MGDSVEMNGYIWRVQTVPPNSRILLDRSGKFRLATTDITNRRVYLANTLHGDFKRRVLSHELTHCAIFSYGLINDIRQMLKPRLLIEGEEWMCNLVADYAESILNETYRLLDEGLE